MNRRELLLSALATGPLAKAASVEVVPSDAAALVISLPEDFGGQIDDVHIDYKSIKREVDRCLSEAGLSHVPWLLFRGIKVDVLRPAGIDRGVRRLPEEPTRWSDGSQGRPAVESTFKFFESQTSGASRAQAMEACKMLVRMLKRFQLDIEESVRLDSVQI